jgi:hypothetical protein
MVHLPALKAGMRSLVNAETNLHRDIFMDQPEQPIFILSIVLIYTCNYEIVYKSRL